MLIHPQINPIAFEIGFFKVHWYGLMYVIGFLNFLWLGKYRARKYGLITENQVDDLLFWGAVGVKVGGRGGYVIFYAFQQFLDNPLFIFKIYNGGMSFHGGLLGVIIVLLSLSYKWNMNFLKLTDFVAPLVPIGLGAGRIGNFINAELWGNVTDVPWGMIFPNVDQLPRHPSQLYQAFLEGMVLFIVLWMFSSKKRSVGQVSGGFLLLYAIFRFLVEFVRTPDQQIGYLAFDWLTMGQILSMPMFAVGLIMILFPILKKETK